MKDKGTIQVGIAYFQPVFRTFGAKWRTIRPFFTSFSISFAKIGVREVENSDCLIDTSEGAESAWKIHP
ncbi:hypothetical protein [Candidatus Enterococcus ferrettii]|uniref:hypothetical protein n=1 Tax=Candidatus Enterococcus ferrettii TaxID=2815324 RepID=UPI001A9BCA91|nr:hypothetical protein [Enterococcus sp. 665A]MBO1342811.1 hypothetical protein [Enterococcus sp. 665A]